MDRNLNSAQSPVRDRPSQFKPKNLPKIIKIENYKKRDFRIDIETHQENKNSKPKFLIQNDEIYSNFFSK